jgi:cytochrome P450
VAADRRRQPRDDVASVIVNSVLDGKPIGDFEAYSYYIALASDGHDTTSCSTVAGGLLALIQNPGEMRKLHENPALIPAGRRGDGAPCLAGSSTSPHGGRGLRVARPQGPRRRRSAHVLPAG